MATTANSITTDRPRIHVLLEDIKRGSVKIPAFQRHFVWKDDQILALLDSIYRGYPVGSVLIWLSKERLVTPRDLGGFTLPDMPDEYPVGYVLDGQQRLTSLYAVFNSLDNAGNRELAERFDIGFSPSDETFIQLKGETKAGVINLNVIFDTTQLIKSLGLFSDDDSKTIIAMQDKFKDYEFPVVTVREKSNQEVCRIFQRINSSGTKLSTFDLLSAWTWSEAFDLREKLKELKESFEKRDFEQIDNQQIMRCLTAVLDKGISEEALADIDPAILRGAAENLNKSMHAAIDFLASEFKIRAFTFLPFPIMLVPLTYFFYKCPKPNAGQRKDIKRWFWNVCFTQRYKAGTNRAVLDDIDQMALLASSKPAFQNLSSDIRPDFFRQGWKITATASKATILLLAQSNPRSLLSGASIDLSEVLAAYNAREYHHIYPRSYLQKTGVNHTEANVIGNICMVTADDNKVISDRDPEDYFTHIPNAARSQILERAFIPSSATGKEPYKDFLEVRCLMLANEAKRLIIQ